MSRAACAGRQLLVDVRLYDFLNEYQGRWVLGCSCSKIDIARLRLQISCALLGLRGRLFEHTHLVRVISNEVL